MFRDQKSTSAARPSMQPPMQPPQGKRMQSKRQTISGGSVLNASSTNNHSLFSFGRSDAPPKVVKPKHSFDFLPSPSFDELQTSLDSVSSDFKLTQFPSPTGQSIIAPTSDIRGNLADRTVTSRNGSTTILPTHPAPARSKAGSILRRPSVTNRQASGSSTIMAPPTTTEPLKTQLASRFRRQSQYPPVSNTTVIGKPPRKSVGPGVLDASDNSNGGLQRRPSAASNTDHGLIAMPRPSLDGYSRPGSTSRNMTASRAAKTRSIQPPPRLEHVQASPNSSSLSVDSQRASSLFPRSPRQSKAGPSTPGSAKRLSVMPGLPNTNHATGLGARTISPTDTRRMKRLSMLPPTDDVATMLQNLPPPPPPAAASADLRSSSHSPSMLPRMVSTPSSSRTTPDTARKSYSSGLSNASNFSHNTIRTSVGSVQSRALPNAGTKMPSPKLLTIPAPHLEPAGDVPPVPAIPKAYESPKEAPTENIFFTKHKSNLIMDTSSIASNSTGSLSAVPVREPPRVQRKSSTRRATQHVPATMDNMTALAQQRKKPQALPPMNLGPLSMPTVDKIAKMQQAQYTRQRSFESPPPRQLAKTPTTPMTASKGTFTHTQRINGGPDRQYRSSSSIQQDLSVMSLDQPSSDSVEDAADQPPSRIPAVSPYLSSSVPKEETLNSAYATRPKTNTGMSDDTKLASRPSTHQRPSGPRAPKNIKLPDKTPPKSPAPLSSPDEPPTPSSMATIRRKLSMSWKRSSSKSGSRSMERLHENGASKEHDSMPPPRLPASATTGNLTQAKRSSPVVTVKAGTSYLEARKRKTSASSLNAVTAMDRTRATTASRGTTASRNGKLDHETIAARPTTSGNASVMQKVLRQKASQSNIRHADLWTADLDKDDQVAEEEMRKLGAKRKETENAAKTLDALKKRATSKESTTSQEASRVASLNIYERGEIIDYNEIYFCGTQNAAKVVGNLSSEVPNFGYDDDRGDYTIVPGDHLAYRYEIVDILGKGSFGQVVRCIDHKTGTLVAVKIIRNKKRFHQQALVEVNILQKLREWDPKNKHSMVNFTHSFYFRGHLCISTELLDMNLYEFIKANQFRGSSTKLVRRFAKQMLSSLMLLKQHKVIHCDLKPENVLLRHPLHSEIKVIDFGSSCFENEKVYTYIQSRFYRSPEVILGMSYGMAIDMWSLGCILAELYTGVPIFPGENEQEQLACIMEVFGPPEKHLIEKSTRKKLFFDSNGKPRLTVSSKGRRRRPSSKTLAQVLKCEDEPFLDFLTKCLRWDPDRRLKADDAIRHEFITGQKAPMSIPRSASVREISPIKRHNAALSTGGVPRPLPEPPAATKPSSNFRTRETNAFVGISPVKNGVVNGYAARRVSTANVALHQPSLAAAKRTSLAAGALLGGTGSNGIPALSSGVSGLPRAAGRTASGKSDLAAAGAAVAMSRRT